MPFHHSEHRHELRLDDKQSLVPHALIEILGFRVVTVAVANDLDEAFTRRQARHPPQRVHVPIRAAVVDGREDSAHHTVGRALGAGGGLADDQRVEPGGVLAIVGEHVRPWADGGAEPGEKLRQNRGRMSLGVRGDRLDDRAGQPDEASGCRTGERHHRDGLVLLGLREVHGHADRLSPAESAVRSASSRDRPRSTATSISGVESMPFSAARRHAQYKALFRLPTSAVRTIRSNPPSTTAGDVTPPVCTAGGRTGRRRWLIKTSGGVDDGPGVDPGVPPSGSVEGRCCDDVPLVIFDVDAARKMPDKIAVAVEPEVQTQAARARRARRRQPPIALLKAGELDVTTSSRVDVQDERALARPDADVGIRPHPPPALHRRDVDGGVAEAVHRPRVLSGARALSPPAAAAVVDGCVQRQDEGTAGRVVEGHLEHGGHAAALPVERGHGSGHRLRDDDQVAGPRLAVRRPLEDVAGLEGNVTVRHRTLRATRDDDGVAFGTGRGAVADPPVTTVAFTSAFALEFISLDFHEVVGRAAMIGMCSGRGWAPPRPLRPFRGSCGSFPPSPPPEAAPLVTGASSMVILVRCSGVSAGKVATIFSMCRSSRSATSSCLAAAASCGGSVCDETAGTTECAAPSSVCVNHCYSRVEIFRRIRHADEPMGPK